MSDTEYDPFKEIDESSDTYARPRGISSLEPGKVFKIIHVSQKASQFKGADGSFPLNTLVQFVEGGLRFITIMPKRFNNKTAKWVEAMNKLISKQMGPKLVYYGRINLGHEADLLRHTQDRDENKLKTVQDIMAKTTPTKDQSGGYNSPNKRALTLDFEDKSEMSSKLPRQD